MNNKMHTFDDMQLFVQVAENNSFVKAAEKLGLATSTISQRIQKLEQRLGLQLLHRTTRKISLTEAGLHYFEKARQIIHDAEVLYQSLDQLTDNPMGSVRISAPMDFTYQIFAPLIPLFYQRFPHIRLDIDTSSRRVDLLSEPFDLAIRMGEIHNENLIARKLTDFCFYLYASQDYLARYGTPQTLAELALHRCLAFQQNHWQLQDRHNKTHKVYFDAVLTGQNLGLLGQLSATGMGIALLPEMLGKHFGLQTVLPHFSGKTETAYAVTGTRLLPKKVQVLIEFLKEHL